MYIRHLRHLVAIQTIHLYTSTKWRNSLHAVLYQMTWLISCEIWNINVEWTYMSAPAMKIDFSKWLAFLLQDFKLISSQPILISKTKKCQIIFIKYQAIFTTTTNSVTELKPIKCQNTGNLNSMLSRAKLSNCITIRLIMEYAAQHKCTWLSTYMNKHRAYLASR